MLRSQNRHRIESVTNPDTCGEWGGPTQSPNPMKVDNEVLRVLSAAQITGSNLVLTGQLDRKLYERTNKVLEAAGGQWNRKAKAHIFPGDAEARIEQVILTGSIEIPKDEFEFFATPDDLADGVVGLAGIEAGKSYLEPSAGRGALAKAIRARGGLVTCYELMTANAEYLAAEGFEVEQRDFLQVTPERRFAGVVMNPPFSKQRDILHVRHAMEFIVPGGSLVAIMAGGVKFRQDRRATEFRTLVSDLGGTIRDLPAESFKASGTSVSTVLAVIPSI